MKNVVIVWDSDDPLKRRTCFWEDLFEKYRLRFPSENCNVSYLSIADALGSINPATRLFNKNKTDVIIINWDAINTDPVYGSDRAHAFFHHFIPDMDAWVRRGGVVIVEEQGMSSRLIESAYAPFTYDSETMERKYRVTVWPRQAVSDKDVHVNKRLNTHPLLDSIDGRLSLNGANLFQRDWFPKDYVEGLLSLEFYNSYKRRIRAGWFTYWRNWDALLFAEKNWRLEFLRTWPFLRLSRRPVLLCRFVEGAGSVGAYILTTLHMASSEMIQLIYNAFNLADSAGSYRELQARRRRLTGVGVVMAAITAALSFTFIRIIGLPTVVSALGGLALAFAVSFAASYLARRWP